MGWTRTSRAVLALDRQSTWAVLSDLPRWLAWNPTLAEVTPDGPVTEGQSGFLVPSMPGIGPVHRRTAPSFTVTEVAPGSRLVLDQPQPGGTLRVQWRLGDADDEPGGTLLEQRVEVVGPLSAGIGPTVGAALARHFAVNAARLHRLATAGVLSEHPVRNAELMATLRRQVGRPWALPTPVPLLRLGGVVLRTDPALGLTGRHATSAVLRRIGFRYRFPRLDSALSDLLG